MADDFPDDVTAAGYRAQAEALELTIPQRVACRALLHRLLRKLDYEGATRLELLSLIDAELEKL